jgi:hypothetical protein
VQKEHLMNRRSLTAVRWVGSIGFLCALYVGSASWAQALTAAQSQESFASTTKPLAPDEGAVAASLALVDEVYEKELAIKTAAGAEAAARQMIADGQRRTLSPPDRFALFKRALDVAVGVGNYNVAIESAQAMTSYFQTDELPFVQTFLFKVQKKRVQLTRWLALR